MIFHISIAADDPKRTATMLAELWRGEAFPFPMVGKGSWVAHAGDDRRSTIEVYPATWRSTRPSEQARSATSPYPATARSTPLSRLRSASKKSRKSAAATAATPRCASAVRFRVIEFWVDNALMLEMLTAEMQAEYQTSITPENWRRDAGAAWSSPPMDRPIEDAQAA